MQSSCEESSTVTTECSRACVLFQSKGALEAAKTLCSQYEWDGVFGPIKIDSYAFETLKTADSQNASIREAINADLLIITADQAHLPSIVRFWMGRFISSKCDRGCTLVALTKVQLLHWDSLAAVREYLHSIAELEGMPFASYRYEACESNICVLSDAEYEPTPESWNRKLYAPPAVAARPQEPSLAEQGT